MYVHLLSKHCQCGSRCKLIHLRLNDSCNCQCGCLVALIILLTQNENSFTLHSHSSAGCSREHFSVQLDCKCSQYNIHRQRCVKVNNSHFAGWYQNATQNGDIGKQQPQIAPNVSTQTGQNPQVDTYRYGFGMPRGSGSGFWTVEEPITTSYLDQTLTAGGLPRPVANTKHYTSPWSNAESITGFHRLPGHDESNTFHGYLKTCCKFHKASTGKVK
jgi:hypothetical protein